MSAAEEQTGSPAPDERSDIEKYNEWAARNNRPLIVVEDDPTAGMGEALVTDDDDLLFMGSTEIHNEVAQSTQADGDEQDGQQDEDDFATGESLLAHWASRDAKEKAEAKAKALTAQALVVMQQPKPPKPPEQTRKAVPVSPPEANPHDQHEAAAPVPRPQATGMKPSLRRAELRRFVYYARHKRWNAADRAACRMAHMKAWCDERIGELLVREDLLDPWRLTADQMGQVIQLTYDTRQLLGITAIAPHDMTAVQFRDAQRAAKTRKQKERRTMQTATEPKRSIAADREDAIRSILTYRPRSSRLIARDLAKDVNFTGLTEASLRVVVNRALGRLSDNDPAVEVKYIVGSKITLSARIRPTNHRNSP